MCGFGNIGDERQPELYYHMNAGVWQIMNSLSLRRMRSSEGGIAPSCACMYPCVLHYAPALAPLFGGASANRPTYTVHAHAVRGRRSRINSRHRAAHARGDLVSGIYRRRNNRSSSANCVYPGWRRRPLSLWAASVHLQAPTDSSLC